VALGLTAACASQDGQGGISKQGAGTVLGGIGGAVIGSQFGKGTGQLVGVAAGTLLGAYLGNEIGKSLDTADRQAMSRSTNTALETGRSNEPVSWRNPDSGNYGTVTPRPAVQTAQGEVCREFTQTINVGGKQEQGYGRACRQPDGSWKIVNN
jgi:surface antigen